jgi:hypothetical protein
MDLSAALFLEEGAVSAPAALSNMAIPKCNELDALRRLQEETAAELNTLLLAFLNRAFKGEL